MFIVTEYAALNKDSIDFIFVDFPLYLVISILTLRTNIIVVLVYVYKVTYTVVSLSLLYLLFIS